MPAIIILGGHRTGTSITARLIHELGFPAAPSTGRLLQPFPGREADNPDGYYEDAAFVRVHRRMLGEHRPTVGGWRNPRRDDAEIRRLSGRYRSLVCDRSRHSADWSIKDPRLCLVGDVLLDALTGLGMEVRVVTTTRPEPRVVASLMRRGISVADAGRIAATFEAGRQAIVHVAQTARLPCLELSLASAVSCADVERQIERLQLFLNRPDRLQTRRLATLVRHAR